MIELMVTFAVTVILLSFAIPALIDPEIRSRVEVGLSFAGPAQEALLKTCESDEMAVVNSNLDAGYFYIPSGSDEDYLNRILLGADCAKDSLVIVIWTGSTGAPVDPVLELSANISSGDSWTCRVITGDMNHVPEACRGS